MKVFISWSGKLSQKIAEELKNWLEQCIQSLEVFYSKEDIEKGELWHSRVSNALSDTNFGIICLTKDNINAPWIHFESGALSKMLESRVATLAINISFADIKGPLSTFQATKVDKDDMYKLLKSINSSMERPLAEEKLKNTFNAFWDNFYKQVNEIILKETEKEEKTPKLNVPEALEEILQLVRNQSVVLNYMTKFNIEDYFEEIINHNKYYKNDVDYIIYKIYQFSQYVFERLGDINHNREIYFIEKYQKFIYELIRDFPSWRRKFDALFVKYRVKEIA